MQRRWLQTTLALFVVNSVKLHLTAFKSVFYDTLFCEKDIFLQGIPVIKLPYVINFFDRKSKVLSISGGIGFLLY